MRDLSIIIPAYNEARRIAVTLESIGRYLADRDIDAEVIVVDDGSTDDTIAVVGEYAGRIPRLTVVPCGFNGGKGRAVRMGMLTGTGRHRLFLDADNSTDIAELDRLLLAADHEPIEPAVVIGSIAAGPATVTRPQSKLRQLMGRLGNRVIQRLVLPGIDDSQRGFKVFTGEAADRIFARCRVDGWAFDVEALAIARGLGYHVLEVPVEWAHCDDSRVRASAYAETLADVARVAIGIRTDRYHLGEPVARPDVPASLRLGPNPSPRRTDGSVALRRSGVPDPRLMEPAVDPVER